MLQAIDPEKEDWAEELSLTNYAGAFPCPGGDFYVDREGGLYAYDIESAEYEEFLNWKELGVDSNSNKRLAISGDDIYFTSNQKLYVLKEGAPEDEPEDEKTVLTLVTDNMFILATTTMVTKFNSENDEYRIEVRECTSAEDEQALILEMTTGKVPDMFIFTNKMHTRPFLKPHLYGAKGFLLDLYTLIDSDPELSRDSFYPNILEAAESGGCLYEMPISIMPEGIVGKSEDVGYEPGWTLADIKEVLTRFPNMKYPFGPTILRNSMLRYLLAANYDSLINWAEGTCNFESQEFMDILELAKLQPGEYDGTEKLEPDLIADGEQLAHPFYLSMANYLQQYPQIFRAEDVTYIGYPTGSGVGNFICYNSSFGISSQTEYADVAWSFLRQEILDDCDHPISINIAATEKYFSDVEKYESPGELGYGRNEGNKYSVKLEYSTPEDIEKMREMISSLDRVARNDAPVYDIVCEEALVYFSGDRTAAEAAAIIQSRVGIYVSENVAG